MVTEETIRAYREILDKDARRRRLKRAQRAAVQRHSAGDQPDPPMYPEHRGGGVPRVRMPAADADV
jgi:hypothetical protein